MVRFNPPPGWPTPPAGWKPPPQWKPDPRWPTPPAGWQLWVDEDADHSHGDGGVPTPAPDAVARSSFANRMRGKWAWAAAALVFLIGVAAGGFADALLFGGLTALGLGVFTVIRESQSHGVKQRPGTLAALIAGGASVIIGGLASPNETTPVANPTSVAMSQPATPNHRCRRHHSQHRPHSQRVAVRGVASQHSPRVAARTSSTSRSLSVASPRTDLKFACLRRSASQAFPQTPRATELASAGTHGRSEQARAQSNRSRPANTLRMSFRPMARTRSGNARRAGSPSPPLEV
jgi:hypothetical protein